ncbi:MAG: hypothetical protein SGJ17_07305 [Hyphomicrobiales bacterium]|nr:hypothetical protein [Hyphomicrobiales bacterium]
MQDSKNSPRPEDRDASDGVIYTDKQQQPDSDKMSEQPDTAPTTDEHLDAALDDTFPASDPPSMTSTTQQTDERSTDLNERDGNDGPDEIPDEFAQKREKPVVPVASPD